MALAGTVLRQSSEALLSYLRPRFRVRLSAMEIARSISLQHAAVRAAFKAKTA